MSAVILDKNLDVRRALDIADRCTIEIPPTFSIFFDHLFTDCARSAGPIAKAPDIPVTIEDFFIQKSKSKE